MEKENINQLIDKYNFKLEETHISWVLIGKDTVYKIKKPVDFGFLDYSSLQKRLEFCQKEIELNRRLAQDMYLGLSKIVETKNGIDIDKDGEIMDYAVKMKKIPQEKMMDVLIKQNKVEEKQIKAIAKITADFHKKAKTDDYITSFGSIEQNRQNTDENFEQTRNAVGEYITQYQYDALKKYTDDFYTNNKALFEKRMNDKKIRDCHGDMYSRNICIAAENEIYIYDCIEFNERFRYSDAVSDVAFLLMDLENYQRYDLSKMFLNYYIDFSNDKDITDIIDFYKIYRAYVRGKIAFFQQNRQEANQYFDLAFGYLPDNYKPKLFVMCGLTGSGKSYRAKQIADKIGVEIISSDEVRKELMNMDKHQKDLSDFKKGIYSDEITKKVYEKLSSTGYELLREGKNVILDATYLTKKLRDDVQSHMKRLGIKPNIVFVDTNDKTVMEHFKKREKEKSASDGRLEIYKEQKKLFEKPDRCIKIEPSGNIDKIII